MQGVPTLASNTAKQLCQRHTHGAPTLLAPVLQCHRYTLVHLLQPAPACEASSSMCLQLHRHHWLPNRCLQRTSQLPTAAAGAGLNQADYTLAVLFLHPLQVSLPTSGLKCRATARVQPLVAAARLVPAQQGTGPCGQCWPHQTPPGNQNHSQRL